MSKEFRRETTTKQLFDDSFSMFTSWLRQTYSPARRVFIWSDMCWCVLRHGASPSDYVFYRFDEKSDRERATYFTMHRFEHFLRMVNTGDKSLFFNKLRFCQRFDKYLKRSWLDVSNATQEEFDAFIRREGQVIVKPTGLSSGHGIWKYTYSEQDDLEALRKKTAGMLMEHVICQHPNMAEFNPHCVNVPRLNTFLDAKGEPHLISALFRSGIGNTVVDNLGSGGMIAHVDPETGIVTNTALDLKRNEYIRHPKSEKCIVGFQIPYWEQAKALVLQAAREVPTVRWVGWDVAILPDGVCLVEGNDQADVRNLQYADRRGWCRAVCKML